MKKLFAISIIILLVSNVFGQTQGIFGEIYDMPEYMFFERNHVKLLLNGTVSQTDFQSMYYLFTKDNKLYMLSYGDPAVNAAISGGKHYERNLYLMCRDNGVWSKASDVIQVDQKFKNGGIRGYLPMFNGDLGGKIEEVGNSILITLACHYIPDGDFTRSGICSSEIYTKKFVLMPNGDGTYAVYHDTKK